MCRPPFWSVPWLPAGLGICLRHWIVEDTNALVRVLVGCSVYALVYLGIVVGAFKVRTPLTLVKRAVGDLAPARFWRGTPRRAEDR